MTQPRPPGTPIGATEPPPGGDEARTAAMLRHVPALLVHVDGDLCVDYVSQPPRNWLAIDAEEWLGHPLADHFDPPSRPQVHERLAAALDGQPGTFEGMLSGHHTRRYMHASLQPEMDASGRVRGLHAVLVDLTERHALELRLRESEERLAAAFAHATAGMALIALDGRFLKVNPALSGMLGYSEAELLTLSMADVTHPDDYAADMARLGEMRQDRIDGYQMDKRNLRRDGRTVYVHLSVSLVRDAQDRPRYLVAQMLDVSRRRHAEEALFRERELAEVTLDSIGDAVLTATPALRVTSLNPIAEGLTGWTAAEARGRPVDEIFRLRDARTGLPCANPLQRAVARNAIVDLPGATLLVHRNGFATPVEDSAAPIHDHAGHVVGGVLVFRDVSETRSLALRMVQLTQQDSLTGLPNRGHLAAQLAQAVATARRMEHRCALLLMDVEHARDVDREHGPAHGDEVLRALAGQLRAALAEDDILYRYHGDRFAVLMPHIEAPGEAVSLAQRLLLGAERTTVPGLPDLRPGLAIGISVFPDDAGEPEALLRHADGAMYEAGTDGGPCYRLFQAHMHEREGERRRIESALRRAIEHDELVLHYQPKVAASDGRIVGTEALLRWCVDGSQRYLPDQFIPVAEDCGLIVPIGRWVLGEAVRQMQRWQARGRAVPVAVNVSPVQFLHEGFLDELHEVIEGSGVDPSLLELELTERTVMSGGEATITLLQRIKALGLRLALDDFGTGYCSLSYLQHFPVDALKIDRAFVRDVDSDRDTGAITQAIIALARSLGKDVVAEGVETEAEAAYLRAAGCAQLQGFLFGPPVAAEALAALLAAQAAAD